MTITMATVFAPSSRRAASRLHLLLRSGPGSAAAAAAAAALRQFHSGPARSLMAPPPPNGHWSNGSTMNMTRAPLSIVLEDGYTLHGHSFGAERPVSGEVVFNTGMSSYPESMTDPSYRGQILTCTYPLIGNFGVPSMTEKDEYGLLKWFESDRIQVSGLIVSNYSTNYAHYAAAQSLSDWMHDHDIPGIYGIDTRALTKHLRSKGSMLGKIVPRDDTGIVDFYDPNVNNLAAEVSIKEPVTFVPPGGGDCDILAIDCGIKQNIIRCLLERGARVKLVPWDHDISKEKNYDGIFYSNGPGNPAKVQATIDNLAWAQTQNKPIFGICMGNQLMAHAAGGQTVKMAFGNRGQNIPATCLEDQRCFITPQNHGFAVDPSTLGPEWKEMFVNVNDGTNEGLVHKSKPFFSVQFHPEAMGGPRDTVFLFDRFLGKVRERMTLDPETKLPIGKMLSSGGSIGNAIKHTSRMTTEKWQDPPIPPKVSKVLVLGSGGLQIGQAGEFDYSGSQAIKALKERGIKSVLVNSNIATVQTAEGLADEVFLEPVTPDAIEEIIEKTQPDGMFLQFGGQTALNCGIELHDSGVLKKYGVKILGTSVPSIIATEDRDIFAKKLTEIGESIATSVAANNTDDAVKAANEIGYPVIVRAAFSLGGLGSGFAHDDTQLRLLCSRAFSTCPQVLIEKSLKGWKEVEYEVVRDQYDNCVTVCNMENFNPLGVHTGDSIVVAPSQTLSDAEYHMLRTASIRVASHLGIIGECNVQFALDPHSDQYCIIEANPRLSRSSALASKATGYPLAFVAAKLALGDPLPQVKNSVTENTTANFEPSLDYIVTKIPRWDLKKFNNAVPTLGSGMKSVGEVMAFGRSFEESFQKAIRMVDPANKGFEISGREFDDLEESLKIPSEDLIYAIATAFEKGCSVDEIHDLTDVDFWYLRKLENIFKLGKDLEEYTKDTISAEVIATCKESGFSDDQIAERLGCSEMEFRDVRKDHGVVPVVKQIDTLAAEFPANTNYLYVTYNGTENDVEFGDKPEGNMVLGGGCYRIGSSVEFDYSAVQAIRTLRSMGRKSVMVNYNPETVSTDYDESDRLYFEELSLERVLDIYDKENPEGTLVSVGGQIPNTLCLPLHEAGVPIIGTHPTRVDQAEDRDKFSSLMDEIGVDQPAWKELTNFDEVSEFCEEVGFPVLVRPSYVLSGAAMNVVRNPEDLERYLKEAADVSSEHPVVISKFIENALEIELDAIAEKGRVVNYAIAEHIEQAGVHSGDATLVLPVQDLDKETERRIYEAGCKVAKALDITGPFNAQFIVKGDEIKIIETNLRASRSLPFCSKVMGINFIEKAVKSMLGETQESNQPDTDDIDYVGVKVPQFSFQRLLGADPVLGVEMASTGEVACFGSNKHEAFLKGMLARGFRMPSKNILLVAGDDQNKEKFLESARSLADMGYVLHATPGTAMHLRDNGVEVVRVPMPRGDDYLADPHDPDVLHIIRSRKVDLVINFPRATSLGKDPDNKEQRETYVIRRAAIDHNVPFLSNMQVAQMLVESLAKVKHLDLKSYGEYRYGDQA